MGTVHYLSRIQSIKSKLAAVALLEVAEMFDNKKKTFVGFVTGGKNQLNFGGFCVPEKCCKFNIAR